MPDIFGPILTADDLEADIVQVLYNWFPVYLRELEEIKLIPPDSLPMPKSFLTADKVDEENADALPSIVVVSPGLSGKKPFKDGDGLYTFPYAIGVGVFVTGPDRSDTMKLVRWYTQLILTVMLHRKADYGDGTALLDVSFDPDFKFTDEQTIGAGEAVFEVWKADVLRDWGGPAVYGQPTPAPDPATQPGEQWPTVNKATATVEVKE